MKINRKTALDLLLDLLRLGGVSGEEAEVADYIEKRALKAGVKRTWIRRDKAHLKSPFPGGQTGNVIITLPGTVKAPRIMFSAHIDKVEIARGAVPVVSGGQIRPKGATALGADDRSGTAVLLHTLITLLKEKRPCPPVTFLFTVQEEIGLFGAAGVDRALLKKPACCYNFDGRQPEALTLKAPSSAKFTVQIKGLAAHAGQHPEQGVSAALVLAKGLETVSRKGMFGAIKRKNVKIGTANIGVVNGGSATNVIMDTLTAQGEARSYSDSFLKRIIDTYRTAFTQAARSVKNDRGRAAQVQFSVERVYTAFNVARNAPAVKVAAVVLKRMGLMPLYPTMFGGLDANWLNSYGIPTVTLGAGEKSPHTPEERQNLTQYYAACELTLGLCKEWAGI